MKAKILELHGHDNSNDDYTSYIYKVDNCSDWDEVTEEELRMLKQWASMNSVGYYPVKKYIIVTEPQIKVPLVLKEMIALAEEKTKKQREKEEKNKKKEEKRLKTLQKNKEAKEKALLAELEAKYKVKNA